MPKAKLAKIPERWSQAIAVGRWLRQRAENVSALLLLAMFLCFILQIAARYVFNRPLGWTDEVSVLCWIWCTLWGAAFVLRERDEVRFDIIYSGVSEQTRRVFTIITGIAAIMLFGIALPAVISYIMFLKVERSAYLGIRLDYLLFDLRGVRDRRDHPLWRFDMARDQGQTAGGRARRRVGAVMGPFGLAICAILGLGLLGLPIGYSMIAGSILYLLLAGLDLGTSAEQILNGLYNSYVLLAVPLFLFSAELMNVSKMTDHLLRFCDMLVGRFRGGLGHINIAQSVIFAGMSGSAIADLAGTGRISIDMMTRNNRYPLSYAAAVTAASAVIGPIIPPSIPMVLYALVSDTSVGYLFLGGVIPGLLMALAQMAINSYMAHKHDYPVEKPIPLREWPMITWVAMPALLMPVILLGGIYGGVMTPTEAAAVAAAYAFLVAALWYRNITVRDTYLAVLNSSRATASIGMLIAGALIFNYVVTIEQIPNTVRGLLAGYDLSPLMFLVVVNIILLVLGCLLEGSTIILVILPIFIPTAKTLGIDLVHFGVVAVVNIMIGLITPPYGLLLFIISAISGAPLRGIIRDTMPFVWAMIVALAMITFLPDTVLWLPRLMGYKG